MTAIPRRLGEVEPRERAGAQTARRYEYQYERTARAALGLLEDERTNVCVYCDWHDDFVVEVGQPPTRYVFHQVKGRELKHGPWNWRDFFGITKAARGKGAASAVSRESILPKMLLHYRNFEDNCAGTVFITNSGLDADTQEFLERLGMAAEFAKLDPEDVAALQRLTQKYQELDPPVAPSVEGLFGCPRFG